MGRKKVFPPVVRVHKGRERVSHNRTWYDLGPVGSDEAKLKYAQLVLQWQTEPESGGLNADDYLISELMADYIERGRVKHLTRVAYAARVFCEHYGVMPVKEFKARHFEAYKLKLCETMGDDGRKRWSESTIRIFMTVIRSAWEWGVIWGQVTPEQVIELRVVKYPDATQARERRVVKPAPRDVLDRVLPHLSPPVAGILRMIAATGMRPSEVCSLTPAHVTRGGVADVPGRGRENLGDVWMVTLTTHKTARKTGTRYVLLNAEARAILEPLWDKRNSDEPFFHPRTRKKPLAVVSLNRAMRRVCERLDIPHVHPYQFRHLAAVLLDERHGREAAQAMLGHTSEHMTSHYTGRNFAAAMRGAMDETSGAGGEGKE